MPLISNAPASDETASATRLRSADRSWIRTPLMGLPLASRNVPVHDPLPAAQAAAEKRTNRLNTKGRYFEQVRIPDRIIFVLGLIGRKTPAEKSTFYYEFGKSALNRGRRAPHDEVCGNRIVGVRAVFFSD